MYRATGRSSSRRDTVLFLGCVALSLGALFAPPAWSQGLATTIRDTALAPLIWLQQRAEEGRTSRARFQEALAARDSAVMAAQAAAGLEAENRELRSLLALRDRTPGAFLATAVLHQPTPTDGRTLLLGAGREAGVRPYQPVLAPEGLLGVVSRVDRVTSTVDTWAHPDFRVSAVTEDGGVLGIVAPSGQAEPSLTVLEFRGVAYRDTVPEGTLVMTSGLGGVYPRGLPIGRVSGVRREELGWERVYRVTPLVNVGVVSHVMLLEASAAAPRPAAGDSTP
jgi:rod shape-determining protein MreC